MATTWHGAFLLGLVSAGIDVQEAARRLVEEGLDAEALAEVEDFVRELDLDPSVRDRALMLVARTRLLADRATAGAATSDRLRAGAEMARAADTATPGGLAGLWRHELATPLAVVDLALETLAARRDDPAAVERMLEVARRNLRLASHLVQGLGSIDDLATGRIGLTWARVDLGALARECAADVGALVADRHEIAVTVEQAVEVPADPDAVRQVVVNLLTNAAKFSPRGAPIQVTVSASADHAEVGVRDRGRGLSSEEAGRVFEPGQRLDPETPGAGLGLFVARQLARAHGGDLDVEHPAAGGSRFVLRLPRSPAEWQHSLERREHAGHARDVRRGERHATADARDAALSDRESIADERDATLADREATADVRDAELDRREDT